MTDPPPGPDRDLSREIENIRQGMRSMSLSRLSEVDQLEAECADQAREILAHHMLAGLHREENMVELGENAAIKMVLTLRLQSQPRLVGIVLVMTEIIAKFLLAQDNGTYAAAVARILDPGRPLIPGSPHPDEDPLWRLAQETEGPSGG